MTVDADLIAGLGSTDRACVDADAAQNLIFIIHPLREGSRVQHIEFVIFF